MTSETALNERRFETSFVFWNTFGKVALMKCIELIVRDHATIARGLDILDGMVQKMETGLRIEISDAFTILKFLQVFVDEYHQTMEEHVLFPALQHASSNDSAVHSMVLEHSEERAAKACIEDALKAKVGKEFVRNARALSRLLRSHFSSENAVLGDLAERLLSEEQDNEIVAKFKKYQPQSYPDFVYLERKYVPELRTRLEPAKRPARAPVLPS
jgi:hemerythrin-like domain-containing protein